MTVTDTVPTGNQSTTDPGKVYPEHAIGLLGVSIHTSYQKIIDMSFCYSHICSEVHTSSSYKSAGMFECVAPAPINLV